MTSLSLFHEVQPVLEKTGVQIHLVGGAVRDLCFGTESNDLDFAVKQNAIQTAFRVGDALGLPAYIMDEERGIGRVVLKDEKTTLDFAQYRAESLEDDLRDRDFTMNAVAMALDGTFVDPTGGLDDIQNRIVRQVNPDAIQRDPVRGLRAVRFAVKYRCMIDSSTAVQVQNSAGLLNQISAERNRDALVKLLSVSRPDQSIRQLLQYGFLHTLLPELAALESLEQGGAHVERVLDHTISLLRWLPQVEEKYRNMPIVSDHFNRSVNGDLTGWQLLRLGALFHDVGKTDTRTVEDGVIRYLDHEDIGAKMTGNILRAFKLSREAVLHIEKSIKGHGRPSALSHEPEVSNRATYRFFNALGSAGLDSCLIALADNASFQMRINTPSGMDDIERTVDKLLTRYVNDYDKMIAPPPLINGNDVIALGVAPGREVGRLLALVRESQAMGSTSSREEAIELIQREV